MSAWLSPRSREKEKLLQLGKVISNSGSNTRLDVVEEPWAAGPFFSFIFHLSLHPTSLMSCHAFIRKSIFPFPFSHLCFRLGLYAPSPLNQRACHKAASSGTFCWQMGNSKKAKNMKNNLDTFSQKVNRKFQLLLRIWLVLQHMRCSFYYVILCLQEIIPRKYKRVWLWLSSLKNSN